MNEIRTGRVIPYITEMFRFQAWMSLGKMANPMSGKVERDLDAARDLIDMLGELETRTNGNRSEEESKALVAALTDLRLNYMEELKKPKEDPAGDSGAPDAETEAEAKAEATAEAKTKTAETVEPAPETTE